jgi:hypothetical protein
MRVRSGSVFLRRASLLLLLLQRCCSACTARSFLRVWLGSLTSQTSNAHGMLSQSQGTRAKSQGLGQ